MSDSDKKLSRVSISYMCNNVLYFDRNTYKYWLTLVICGYVVSLFHPQLDFVFALFLFVSSISLSLLLDGLYYVYNIQYYDPQLVIVRGYSTSSFFNDSLHSVGIDYGFNFYDGDYTKTPAKAQVDKFHYAVKQLGIEKGDRVIDIGCGCGDWLHFLQTEMECKVVGVNITAAQAKECHSRGLTVYISNWKHIETNSELRSVLYGKFDHVTFWDTVEHYVSMGEALFKRKQRGKVYQAMFRLTSNLIDPKSTKKNCWISCLHMRHPVYFGFFSSSVKKMFYIYLLDKFHSGFYPSYYKEDGEFHDELVDNAKPSGIELQWRKDVTLDYYMTSKINETHFGRHRFEFNPLRVCALCLSTLTDPYWLHRMLWYFQESWMLQFDEQDINNSDVLLWWLSFKLKQKKFRAVD